MLTFGLLSPGKGVEYAIKALPELVKRHPDLVYVILGATHPHVLKDRGEEYRHGLQHLAEDLGVLDNVIFQNRYVDLDELCEFLMAADIYVTPSLAKDQIASGTLAYAMGAGKAIVSHDQRERLGQLFPEAIIDAIESYTGDESTCHSRHRQVHVDQRIRLSLGSDDEKMSRYGELVRALMEDQWQWIQDPSHARKIKESNGRDSLAMAVEANKMAQNKYAERMEAYALSSK